METDRYKIGSRTYINSIFKPLLFNWLGVSIAILIIPAFILSFYDIRFLLILLMIIFLIIPLILFFTYIIYGFKAEARYSILEKSAEFTDDCILIKYDEEHKEILYFNEIKFVNINKHNIVFNCKKENKFIFIVPLSAFKASDDCKDLIKLLEANKISIK